MSADRVRVLGQLLMEALDEKYPPAERQPPHDGLRDTLDYYRSEATKWGDAAVKIQEELNHWKATAEKASQTIRELHAEVQKQRDRVHDYQRELERREECLAGADYRQKEAERERDAKDRQLALVYQRAEDLEKERDRLKAEVMEWREGMARSIGMREPKP